MKWERWDGADSAIIASHSPERGVTRWLSWWRRGRGGVSWGWESPPLWCLTLPSPTKPINQCAIFPSLLLWCMLLWWLLWPVFQSGNAWTGLLWWTYDWFCRKFLNGRDGFWIYGGTEGVFHLSTSAMILGSPMECFHSLHICERPSCTRCLVEFG